MLLNHAMLLQVHAVHVMVTCLHPHLCFNLVTSGDMHSVLGALQTQKLAPHTEFLWNSQELGDLGEC